MEKIILILIIYAVYLDAHLGINLIYLLNRE